MQARRPIEAAQYLSIKYSERLAEAGIEPSVGSVGDSYDNALAETIGLFKADVIHRRGPWRTFKAVEFATLEWVDWFTGTTGKEEGVKKKEVSFYSPGVKTVRATRNPTSPYRSVG